MIEDPVALTIKRTIERAPKDIVGAFAGAETGMVADSANGMGSVHYSIKPLQTDMAFAGTAVTAGQGPGDLLGAMALLDHVQPGDVLVIATGMDESGATVGDNYALAAKQRGAVAIVTDGVVRDIAGILRAGIPVFCRGVVPNSGYRNGPATINLPVSFGGQIVEPGDVLVGDRDGIVVVPKAKAAAIAEKLRHVQEIEAASQKRLAGGEKRSFWKPEAIEARGGVKYID